MKILAVYHSKGGVGKTATAVNLAYLAAASGARTLLCDLDPQSSATFYFRIKPRFKTGSKGFIKGGKRLEKNIKGSDHENLDLLPADFSFRKLDRRLEQVNKPRQRLAEVFASLVTPYEYVFVDCPPTLTTVAENIFIAADYLLIPVIPTTLSVRSYLQVRKFIKKKNYDHHNIFTLFSMVEKRKTMHREVMQQVRRRFPGVLENLIPYRTEVEKMGWERLPVALFAPSSSAARAYGAVWEEIQVLMEVKKKKSNRGKDEGDAK